MFILSGLSLKISTTIYVPTGSPPAEACGVSLVTSAGRDTLQLGEIRFSRARYASAGRDTFQPDDWVSVVITGRHVCGEASEYPKETNLEWSGLRAETKSRIVK